MTKYGGNEWLKHLQRIVTFDGSENDFGWKIYQIYFSCFCDKPRSECLLLCFLFFFLSIFCVYLYQFLSRHFLITIAEVNHPGRAQYFNGWLPGNSRCCRLYPLFSFIPPPPPPPPPHFFFFSFFVFLFLLCFIQVSLLKACFFLTVCACVCARDISGCLSVHSLI